MLTRNHPHPRSNRRAIALGSHQLDLYPVLFVAALIAQQRWQIVHIQNQYIHVAVVVIVSECGSPAGEMLADAGSHLWGHVFETAVAEIPVHQPGILESLPEIV